MTKAFDTALFVPEPNPAIGQASGVSIVGPPYSTDWYYYAIAGGPGITINANIPAATALDQTLMAGPAPDFLWEAKSPFYLGGLTVPPSTNPAMPPLPPAGAMYYNLTDKTPYVLSYDVITSAAIWTPLPVATRNMLIIAASLPAATGQGQMLISGGSGSGVYPWTASLGMFLGANSVPPVQAPPSAPIPPGSFYYNTSNNTVYVWDGSTWRSIAQPTKASTATLYYKAVASQTAFPMTINDLFGKTYTLKTTGVEPVEVYLNGVRLVPTGGSVPGDYSVNYTNSVVTLSQPAVVSDIVIIDILEDPLSLSPTVVLVAKVKSFLFDGTTTTFPLLFLSTNAAFTAGAATDLHVVVDGVEQEPGTDFTIDATGANIIFAQAPAADARHFALYYSKS
jgi:hypothetical protein